MAQISSQIETKLKMTAALKNLLKEKPFTKITVSDIADSCSINRNTFYYHFDNMYDLLYWGYAQEIENIVNTYHQSGQPITQIFDIILDYLDENAILCKTTYESLGDIEMKNMLEKEMNLLISSTIGFIQKKYSVTISEDFRNFLIFHNSASLSSEIVWYIKYNKELDRNKFKEYLVAANFYTLETAIKEGAAKGL